MNFQCECTLGSMHDIAAVKEQTAICLIGFFGLFLNDPAYVRLQIIFTVVVTLYSSIDFTI